MSVWEYLCAPGMRRISLTIAFKIWTTNNTLVAQSSMVNDVLYIMLPNGSCHLSGYCVICYGNAHQV